MVAQKPAGTPVLLFLLALIIVGVVSSAFGVKESTNIIVVALGGVALVLHGRRA